MKDKFVKIQDIMPSLSYTYEPLVIEKENKSLRIYYINRYQNNKIKSAKFQPKEANIPELFYFSTKIVELMGLYQGDGQKSTNSKSYQAVRFSNSIPALIKDCIKFLKLCNVNIKELKLYLRVRFKDKKLHSEEEIINYWSNALNFPKENIYKIQWVPAKTNKFYKFGTATVIYGNSSFRLFFDALFNYTKQESIKKEEYAISFLRGLIAADGNVYWKNSNREVGIAAKFQKDRDYC